MIVFILRQWWKICDTVTESIHIEPAVAFLEFVTMEGPKSRRRGEAPPSLANTGDAGQGARVGYPG